MTGTVTDSADPVEAVREILEWATDDEAADTFEAGYGASTTGYGTTDSVGLTSDSHYPNARDPDRIQAIEDSEPSERLSDQRRADVSLYIVQTTDADESKLAAAGGVDATHTVAVGIYHHDSDTVDAYRRAVKQIVAGFASDNRRRTDWVDISPDGAVDDRGGNFTPADGFAIEAENVRLRRYDDFGAPRL